MQIKRIPIEKANAFGIYLTSELQAKDKEALKCVFTRQLYDFVKKNTQVVEYFLVLI